MTDAMANGPKDSFSYSAGVILETEYPEYLLGKPAERSAQVTSELCAIADRYAPLPPYGDRWRMSPTEDAKGGVGVAAFSQIPGEKQEFVVVMVHPNIEGKRHLVQAPGGHVNFSAKETLKEGAQREVNEEIVMPNGRPVFPFPIKDRLFQLDHKLAYPEERGAIYVDGFGMELTTEELFKVYELERTLEEEPLRASFVKATDNEIYGISVMSLTYLLQHPEILHHKDQKSLFEKLGRHLQEQGRYVMPPEVGRGPVNGRDAHIS
jgi:hypothetical protein